jgi:hypothetical protein
MNESKASMGRLLSFLLFVIVSAAFLFKVFTGQEITSAMRDILLGGWGTAIIGKGIQKFAERAK